MGVSCNEVFIIEKKGNKFSDEEILDIYESLKSFNGFIQNQNNSHNHFYLVKAKSIPKLLKIMNESDIKNNFTGEQKLSDNDKNNVIKHFKDYKNDERIVYLSNFVQCYKLAEQDIKKENKFIIVDEIFVEKISKIDNINKIRVDIKVDNPYNKIQFIKLNKEIKEIAFKKIDYIFYKFIIDKDESLRKSQITNNDVNPDLNPTGREENINQNKNLKSSVNIVDNFVNNYKKENNDLNLIEENNEIDKNEMEKDSESVNKKEENYNGNINNDETNNNEKNNKNKNINSEEDNGSEKKDDDSIVIKNEIIL
jgi:hypothetical protein